MASDIFNVEPPRWLQSIARPIDTKLTGQTIGMALGAGMNAIADDTSYREGIATARLNAADPMWKAKWELAQDAEMIRKADWLAKAESYHWLAQQRKQDAVNRVSDVQGGVFNIAQKIASGDELTPEEQSVAANVKSQDGVKAIERAVQLGTQRQAVRNNSLSAKIAAKDASDFVERLAKIDPTSRAAIRGMTPGANGTPSEKQWAALGMAEESLAQSEKNAKDLAILEAQKRGDQVTTTVTGDKVTQRFSPAPATKPADQYPVPTVIDIGGKQYWAYKDFKPEPVDSMNKQDDWRLNYLNFQLREATKQRNEYSANTKEYKELDATVGSLTKQIDALFSEMRGRVSAKPSPNSPSGPTVQPSGGARFQDRQNNESDPLNLF